MSRSGLRVNKSKRSAEWEKSVNSVKFILRDIELNDSLRDAIKALEEHTEFLKENADDV